MTSNSFPNPEQAPELPEGELRTRAAMGSGTERSRKRPVALDNLLSYREGSR